MAKNEAVKFDDLAFDEMDEGASIPFYPTTIIPGPYRSEDELQDIGEQLIEAKEAGKEVVLVMWKRRDQVWGTIDKLDANTQTVHVDMHGQIVKVPFVEIMEVRNPE